ncbi:MAG: hypothetical protein IKV03_06810 [Alphaproteobacteria bacterium]|nr:hypothetical protein [Alphaproteobacteria bacterium]MBR5130908.1 hypothetical protein [Alphaproteobacteria bacterium]
MKKIILTSAICLLTTACATDGSISVMTKLKNCLTEKSWTAVADGTLYNNGINTTAKQISEICLNELSLQDMGIENQTAQTATTILNAMASAKQPEK